MKTLLLLLMLFFISCGQSAVKTSTAPTAQQTTINVELSFSAENLENGKPKIVGQTNLPDDTDLMISITGKSLTYNGSSKAKVINKKFSSEEFSKNSAPLPKGQYIAEVLMPTAWTQPKKVQEIIGGKAENLKGEFVQDSGVSDSGFVVKSIKPFEIK